MKVFIDKLYGRLEIKSPKDLTQIEGLELKILDLPNVLFLDSTNTILAVQVTPGSEDLVEKKINKLLKTIK